MIVIGIALLSASGLVMILGVGWLVSHLVLGVSSDILLSRLHGMIGVLPALFALVAFIGAACAASALANNKNDEGNETQASHPLPKPR